MIWLLRRLRLDIRRWERSTQIAFVIAVVLLISALVSLFFVPADTRLPVLLGAAALLIVLQLTVLWGNRDMISAFTRAQRLFIDGDFIAVRDLLESVRAHADGRVLTLLGNTYRQLGQLHESEAVLSEAVDKAPNHYFPFYGFGRTLLAEGRYAEAVDAILRALELGAPAVVRVDLGEAYYRLDQTEEAAAALDDAVQRVGSGMGEPYRALMVEYLRYRLGHQQAEPPASDLINAGLPYWQAAAERFRETPYGAALMLDVREMAKLGLERVE